MLLFFKLWNISVCGAITGEKTVVCVCLCEKGNQKIEDMKVIQSTKNHES